MDNHHIASSRLSTSLIPSPVNLRHVPSAAVAQIHRRHRQRLLFTESLRQIIANSICAQA